MGGGAKSYTPSQKGRCLYRISVERGGGGGAHPLHHPPGSSPAFVRSELKWQLTFSWEVLGLYDRDLHYSLVQEIPHADLQQAASCIAGHDVVTVIQIFLLL